MGSTPRGITNIALWSNGRTLVSDARSVSSNLTGAAKYAPIAQMDEQRSSKPLDVGSSPTRGANMARWYNGYYT